MTDLATLSLTAAVTAIAKGEMSAESYVSACLRNVALNSNLNAFYLVDHDQSLAAARAVDVKRAQGETLGPLAGIPLAIKDNIETAGMTTTAGTPLLDTYKPAQNAAILEPLLNAGAFVLGKTNMHELAYGITNNNPFRGPTHNPFDTKRIAGGSSGGSAVAVAAGMAPAALGTDTGGSVRIPAALCGLVGFRPSHGMWSQAGIVPISSTRDTAGPITRRVEDAALIHEIVTGQTPLKAQVPNRLRLGVPRNPFWLDLDPEVKSCCSLALDRLAEFGVTLIELDAQEIAQLGNQAAFPIALCETLKELPAFFEQRGLQISLADIAQHAAGKDVKEIFAGLLGDTDALRQAYTHAIDVLRPALAAAYSKMFDENALDGLLIPTVPATAPLLGEDDVFVLNGALAPTFQTFVRNTGPMTIVGLPGISLPVGLSAAGLPVGLELVAPFGQDRALLANAAILADIVA